MSDQAFPRGWDEKRVRGILQHYDSQDEDEQSAEIESVCESEEVVSMAVPADLAPVVQALIARCESA